MYSWSLQLLMLYCMLAKKVDLKRSCYKKKNCKYMQFYVHYISVKEKRRCRTWKKAFHFDEVQFTCFFSGSCLWCLLIYSMDTKIYCHVSFKIFIILVFAFRFLSDFVLILCWCKVGVQLHSLACSSLAILLKINGASLSQKGYRTQGNPD